MRQGQQNRRGRGRGGRKPQNPLARSLESNGPDVKIRGTASHIAEKYSALARDAISSGDIIMAENYYQHAEHYYRIIMAAQAQQPVASQPAEGANGSGGQRGPAPDGQPAVQDDAAVEKEPIVAAAGEAEAMPAAPVAPNGDGGGEQVEKKQPRPRKAVATNGGGSEQGEETSSEPQDAPSKTPAA
jgi:hypothetical protein